MHTTHILRRPVTGSENSRKMGANGTEFLWSTPNERNFNLRHIYGHFLPVIRSNRPRRSFVAVPIELANQGG